MKVEELKKLDEDVERELEELARGTQPPADAPAEGKDTAKPPEDTSPPDKKDETPGTGLTTHPDDDSPPAPKPEETVEYWREQTRIANERYAAVNGKYMAEVPRLNARIDQLTQYQTAIEEKDREIQDLKGKLAEALKKAAEGAPQAVSEEDAAIKAALDKMRYDHGDDIADAMTQLTAPLQAMIKALKVELVEAKSAKAAEPPIAAASPSAAAPTESQEEKFFTDLTLAVPDWLDINDGSLKTKWRTFLGTINPATGRIWQTDLDAHHSVWNVGGVADIFNAFKKTLVAAAKPADNKPKLEGLDEHIDPATKSGGNKPPETVKTYTQAEIDAFDEDIMKGRAQKTMTAAEIQTRLDEYDRAAREGRVR